MTRTNLRAWVSLRRVGQLSILAVVTLICISCGEVYRPVVIPTSTTPPNPASFHAVFAINANAPFNQGTALQIDVAGDTNIGEANMGLNPTHIGILPNNGRLFVASAGSILNPPGPDLVTSFTPASNSSIPTGLGNPVVFSLPPGSQPDFVNTTQTNAVYVANFGTNSVSLLNPITNTVTQTSPVGSQPVAIAETPDGLNVYVVNQGDNTVTDLSPTDLSTIATLSVGTTPIWAVARPDSKRVYVVTQGDGNLYTIHTDTQTVDPTVRSVGGAGANFALYDKIRNRVYVTNPTAGALYVFDVSVDPPAPLTTIMMSAAACPGGCSPVSVTALPDGSRFYVASYQTQASCLDPIIGAGSSCIVPMLTVFDAASFAVKTGLTTSLPKPSPSLSLLSTSQFGAGQYAVPAVASCAPVATYVPGATRFRMFTTASVDGSHVYASICDAGTIADINTSTTTLAQGTNAPDSLITDIIAPFAACSGASCGLVANITGFQIKSNVVTFQATNSFYAGEQVVISGLTTGTYLDGQTLTVLGAGLSGTSFSCSFSNADVSATADSGSAVPLPAPQSPLFLLTGQ